jgi:hypothetical protein
MTEKKEKKDNVILGENNIVNTSGGNFINVYRSTKTLGSIPPLPPLFIGRQRDLLILKTRLGVSSPQNLHQPITVIRGLPGSGKSTLVSELAHEPEIANTFPDGVLWVSLGMYVPLLSQLHVWNRALGIGNDNYRSVDEASTQIASVLRDKRMLLIIDDVWNTQDATPFMVGGRECSTLLTTRLTSVAQEIAPTPNDIYTLAVLSEAESFEFLKLLAPTVTSEQPDKIKELAQTLEGLPLALEVAGRLLNTEASYGFGINELLEQIQTGEKILASHAPSSRLEYESEITPTISALLKESTDKLDETSRNCFAILGVFAPKPATFDLAAMKVIWEVDDPKPIVRALVERGLLEYVPSIGQYQMHSLLVAYAKTLLNDE